MTRSRTLAALLLSSGFLLGNAASAKPSTVQPAPAVAAPTAAAQPQATANVAPADAPFVAVPTATQAAAAAAPLQVPVGPLPAPAAAPAAEPTEWLRPPTSGAAAWTSSNDSSMTGVKAAAAVITLAALVGVALFARRKRGGSAPAPQLNFKLVSKVRVGAKADAVVAQVGSRFVLLGVTDTNVTKLAWLKADEVFARDEAPATTASGNAQGTFGAMLHDALGRNEERSTATLLAERQARDPVDLRSTVRERRQAAGRPLSSDVEDQAAQLVRQLRNARS